MRIEKIRIHNFRSIHDLEMTCTPYMVLLGPNNHGKSNILSAIEFALLSSAKPVESDFFHFRGDEASLWVELTFGQLTEQEQNTFKRYVRADGSICIRKSATISDSETIDRLYNGYIQQPEEWWLQNDHVSRLTNRAEVDGTPLKDLIPNTGRITQLLIRDAQSKYISDHRRDLTFHEVLEASALLGLSNVAGGILPDFYLIPAVRDLADETKTKGTTAFGRLLSRAVQEMAERNPLFRELKQHLDELVRTLNRSASGTGGRPEQLVTLENDLQSELRHWGVNVEIEVVPPVIDKIFELGTNLHLDDGVRTLAEQKGHGLQRAVLFALIRSWANSLRAVAPTTESTTPRARSESLIFAMEEPELFLHPQAQRRLATAIREISESPDHQVLVCSHSAHFIDLDRYRNISIVTKPSPQVGTTVRQCATELFEESTTGDRKRRFHMARWINPDRGEMFFAKRVAFVEGETEKTLLPFLAQRLGCLDEEISVIDCGSKHNLPLYITIANAFRLEYVVVHDEDPLPEPLPPEWNSDKTREKRHTFELNADIAQLIDVSLGRVEMLSSDFERVAGVSRSQGDKMGKALAALEYFEEKPSTDIPERLQQVVRSIFAPTVTDRANEAEQTTVAEPTRAQSAASG